MRAAPCRWRRSPIPCRVAIALAALLAVARTPPGAIADTRVTFARTATWDTGYVAEIVIHAPPGGLNRWRLAFDLVDPITSLWNGVLDASGSAYVVHNAEGNGSVAAGATVAIGFGASTNGAPHAPSGCVLNGSPCTFEAAAPPPGGASPPGAATLVIEGVDDPQGFTPAAQLTVRRGSHGWPCASAVFRRAS
jgi:hypothetical protein